MSSETVRCSHILIKHKDVRRPASYIDPEGKRIKATTRDQAYNVVTQIRNAIVESRNGNTFVEYAKTRSDCSSGANGGDLGHFTRGQMQKPFEDASFALQVGQLSNVIDTDSGCHIILRTE